MRSANSNGSGTLLCEQRRSSVVEVEALDVLHRDEELLVGAPEVEHLHDVGVAEARRELRLVHEHLGELGMRRRARGGSA